MKMIKMIKNPDLFITIFIFRYHEMNNQKINFRYGLITLQYFSIELTRYNQCTLFLADITCNNSLKIVTIELIEKIQSEFFWSYYT